MDFAAWSASHTTLAAFVVVGFSGALNRLLTVGQGG